MRSDAIKRSKSAPQRSLLNALGMTKEEMDKPLIELLVHTMRLFLAI